MMNWEMNFLIILFLISSMMFLSMYKHLLMTLISLEFMIMNLSLLLYLNFSFLNLNIYFIAFFWTICVCESIMGLSILVYLSRKLGNDYTKILNLMN
uniref:NADH dehydrogenase subunit 4L n=1 Tax=Microplitis manilae TaxID=1427173 RepID=UPI002551F8C4|nr:NADH dehydrogenase subunit 4L [Microplitis manilae]WGS91489.1 NADH dehydrogenase subunit 4L [Microplitis manilae]WUY11108.1 NADH dehydrogenase subunit 4L [Microplitis manilae]